MQISALIPAAVLLVLGFCASPAPAEDVSGAAAGAAQSPVTGETTGGGGAAGSVGSAPPAYFTDALNKKEAAVAEEQRNRPPRGFFDLYYGSVTTENGNVSSSSQGSCFIFCGTPQAQYFSGQASYRESSAFGIRLGRWFDKYPALGIALDMEYLRAEATNVSIWYLPISFEPLVRYTLLETKEVPDGRLQFYGGLNIALVLGGVSVGNVGGSDTTMGFGALLGAAWHFPSFAIFGEYRLFDTKLSYDSKNDYVSFGGQQNASAQLRTRQIVGGVSFKF